MLAGLTHLFMVHSLSLRHGDPAPELARRIGAAGAEARCSGMGGSIPQWLVNRAAELVAAGSQPRVLIAGAEALATRRRARKQGVELALAVLRGLARHVAAARARPGRAPGRSGPTGSSRPPPCTRWWSRPSPTGPATTPPSTATAMGDLMARFNAVAVANPVSWFPTPARRRGDHDGHARQPR